jgi:hypothetical protein
MPGFTTDLHMSDDGYAHPDNGNFVYLGFYYGSAALNQPVDGDGGPKPYWVWLWHFFAHALTDNLTVKQALDDASQDMWTSDFGRTNLHTGYQSIWPMYYADNVTDPQQWDPYWHYESGQGKMQVYGNANLVLYQPALTLSATGGLSPTFTIDGQPYFLGTHRIIGDVYTFDVSDISGYTFDHFSYKGINYYGRPANIQIDSDGELAAHYIPNITYYTLSISSSGQGSTSPTGNQQYESGYYAQVGAEPDDGWQLDYWNLDGQNMGNDPVISVHMTSNRNLQAVFVEDQSSEHDLNVLCYDQYYNPGYASLYIDSQYVGTTTNIYNVTEGQHTLEVPSQVGQHTFYAWYYDGAYHYNTQITVSIYSDKTVVAYYLYPY